MAKAIALNLQHEVEDLKAYYRASNDAVERRRLQVVWLLAEGRSRQEVAELTAYSRVSLYQTVKRYNTEGLEGLRDRRHENQGFAPLLDTAERERLLEAMKDAENGVWTAVKIQHWIERELGKSLYLQRIYELLDQLGFSLQSPRPAHVKADPAAQEDFKKTSCQSA